MNKDYKYFMTFKKLKKHLSLEYARRLCQFRQKPSLKRRKQKRTTKSEHAPPFCLAFCKHHFAQKKTLLHLFSLSTDLFMSK
jgi:hypothetical protein